MQSKNREIIIERLSSINNLSRGELIKQWQKAHQRPPSKGISRRLLEYSAAYQIQVKTLGGMKPALKRRLLRYKVTKNIPTAPSPCPSRSKSLSPGTRLVREWHGTPHTVEVLDKGFTYDGEVYKSLSKIANVITGTRWSGPRFFGI